MEYLILVDKQDRETGTAEKLQAHRDGSLHRAVSVFVFNSAGELLLQQRANGKYHSANLWTNTCCTHPAPGETAFAAANRRLMQEMGMTCGLKEAFSFIYKAYLDHDLTEHEFDHVFTGVTDMLPKPDSSEVAAWRYAGLAELEKEMEENPGHFTEWFKICLRDWRDAIVAGVPTLE